MVTNLRVEDWHSLHQRLQSIAKRRAALDAEEARCLREAEALRLWRRLGYIHMNEYLERELGYGPHAAAERLRVARELGELPQIEASLADGALAFSAVRELTRIATGETEAAWLAEARGKNLRQIEALISGRKRGDRPCDPTDPALVKRVVRLELLPAAFALLRQTQNAIADEHGARLDDSALVEILCRRALEGDGSSDRPAHQIAITVCESCRRGWQNGGGREIEIGPEVIARARCDAELLGSLDAPEPARLTSTVTPRIRRQVLARDHHRCTVEGCRSARNLDLHHIEYQRDGGGHALSNLTTICTGHHQQLHDGALTIRGKAPDALEFTWRAPTAGGVDRGDLDREAPAAAGRASSHVGRGRSPEPLVRDARGVSMPAEDRAPAAPPSTSSHVGSPVPPAQLLREARAPRTTAGYRAHEARGTVENQRSRARDCAVPEDNAHATSATSVSTSSHVEAPAPPAQLLSAVSAARTTAGRQAHEARGTVENQRSRTRDCAVPEDKVHTMSAISASASSHVGAPVPPAQLIREARAALTTAGYRAHEARVAVETARSHVGDQVTLAQLIREALRCCRLPGGS